MKDKRACIFYFLMTIIFLDFGNHLRRISYNSYVENINNFIFSVVHVNNTGSAFGLFQNNAKLLAIFGILIVFLIVFEVFKNISFDNKNELLALTLFSAGTLGNIIERLQFGHVADYIKLNFIDFPIFNAFDIMICIGIFLYFICIILDYKNEANKNRK